jgi:glycerophosphoryl diester phosphodiesterase
MAANADYVELDARQSADGTLYCLHDDTLDRTTDAVSLLGRKKIRLREVHDADVARLDAGAWFKPRFAGERLPTLAAALDAIQASSRTLLEHKDGPADAYARLLREKRLVGRLIVQSFDWSFLADLHRLEPGQPLAALGDKAFDEQRWTRLPATGANIVAWKHTDISAELVAELHKRGHNVFAWTADEPSDWRRLADIGIDGIITNRPGALIEWLRE